MKLSDDASAAFVGVIGNDAQAIAKRKGIPEARQDRRTAARRRFLIYTRLLKIEGTRRFIPKAESLERLKRLQVAYFDSATAGDYEPDFTLHNGHHARAYLIHAQGVPLRITR